MFETVVYSPLFGIVLSIAAFEAGIWIQKKTRKAICNPLVIAILLCIAVLVLFDIPLEAYNKGGDIINLFLGPATAVLALNIYNQMDVLKSTSGRSSRDVPPEASPASAAYSCCARPLGWTIPSPRRCSPRAAPRPSRWALRKARAAWSPSRWSRSCSPG